VYNLPMRIGVRMMKQRHRRLRRNLAAIALKDGRRRILARTRQMGLRAWRDLPGPGLPRLRFPSRDFESQRRGWT
jgi:hypothetical protein